MANAHPSKITYNSFYYILGFTINACLGAFFFGYMMAELNLLIIDLKHQYNWSAAQNSFYKGLLNALNPIGAILGTLISGNFFSKISRKWALLIADFIGIIGSIFCLFLASSGIPQIIGRFLCGIATGINSQVIPLYINELSPIEISGVMGTFFQFFINLGILISYLMGLGIPDENSQNSEIYDISSSWWKLVFAFPILTCVLRAFLLFFVYDFDTPFSLLKQGKKPEMLVVLRRIYQEKFVDEIVQNLENKIKSYRNVSYSQIFTQYRRRLLVGLLLMITQQFSGCNAILTDSSTLFDYDGNSEKVKIYTIVTSLALLISAAFSGKLSDKYGRRTLLLWGNGVCSILLIVMGVLQQPQQAFDHVYMKELSIYLTFLFIFSFGMSLAPICWVYEPEILPEKGVSLAVFTNWLFCGFIVFLTPILIDLIGISPLYYFFGCYLMGSHVHMYFWLKETKGKTNKEIDEMFGDSDGNTQENKEENQRNEALLDK